MKRVQRLINEGREQQKARPDVGCTGLLGCPRPSKCTVCKKKINLDDASSFKTGMHGGMHFYVCSTKCLWDYYKPNASGQPRLA